MVGYCKHHVLLVHCYHLHIHDILRKRDATGSHGEDASHVADDAESDVARDIHGVVGEEGGAGIDDEDDDQNHGKLEPKVEWEVHLSIPILVIGRPLLDKMDFLSFPEAELFVRFEEGFEVEAAAVAAEVDHTAAQDPLKGVDDAHTFHNTGVHTLLHGHRPPRNSRRWPHCNSRMPIAEGVKRNLVVDFANGHHTED